MGKQGFQWEGFLEVQTVNEHLLLIYNVSVVVSVDAEAILGLTISGNNIAFMLHVLEIAVFFHFEAHFFEGIHFGFHFCIASKTWLSCRVLSEKGRVSIFC